MAFWVVGSYKSFKNLQFHPNQNLITITVRCQVVREIRYETVVMFRKIIQRERKFLMFEPFFDESLKLVAVENQSFTIWMKYSKIAWEEKMIEKL